MRTFREFCMEKGDNQLVEILGAISKIFSNDPRIVNKGFYDQIPEEYRKIIDEVLDDPKSRGVDVSVVRSLLFNSQWEALKEALDKIQRIKAA